MGTFFRCFTRHVSQAYVQSEPTAQLPIFVRRSVVLKLSSGFLLRVMRSLYGQPEPDLHWYRTNYGHQVEKFTMQSDTRDPGFSCTDGGMSPNARFRSILKSFTCLQRDDTANAGSDCFITQESKMAKRFDGKPASVLNEASSIKFYGGITGLQNSISTLS